MSFLDDKATQVFPGYTIDKNISYRVQEKVNLPLYIVENLILQQKNDGRPDNLQVEELIKMISERVVSSQDSSIKQAEIRDTETMVIIDKVNARPFSGKSSYLASLLNLEVKKAGISEQLIKQYPQLLGNGLWCELTIRHLKEKASKNIEFEILELNPIQLTSFDLDQYINKANKFKSFQWLYFLLRSTGLEPFNFSKRTNLLLLSRLIPFVERNYNFIELGPRGTGKSYIYRQISSDSILVSGGKTTVANLFFNMGINEIGLVGKRNVIAFDEVAYVDFKDKTSIQILKDYMESGSFSRGKEELSAQASIVFLGNMNHDIRHLLINNNLFEPLPSLMKDMALIDRMHFYLPGWEINKFKDVDLTNHLGLSSNYLSTAFNKLRDFDYTDYVEQHFEFDTNLDVRDMRAIKKTVSGYLKLLHPGGNFTKDDMKLYLDVAVEGRKRVKEQLTKMGPFEYKKTTFEYTDRETRKKYFPVLPEDEYDTDFKQRLLPPGEIFVGQIIDQELALARLKVESTPGVGKLFFTGQINSNFRKQIRKTYLNVKGKSLNIKKTLESYDFNVELIPILKTLDGDVSKVFFVALYSLINEKSITTGFIVSKTSKFYRDVRNYQVLKALKIEEDDGQVRTLLPIKNNNVYVEIPREVFSHSPFFIRLD